MKIHIKYGEILIPMHIDYLDHDGQGADNIVTKLKSESKFDCHLTNIEFMEGIAKRQEIYSGDKINTESTSLFLDDLLRLKLFSFEWI